MRILFISNFFPPARSGGYTQWCHEVTERLAMRGHEIGVLTSRYELSKASAGEHNIYRLLHLEGDLFYYQPLHLFTQWKGQLRENLEFLEQTVESFSPDILFVWGMWALTKSLAAKAERLLPDRVVYYLSDYWLSTADMHTVYWQSSARHWLMRAPKRVIGKVAMSLLATERYPDLKLERVICVSSRVREILVNAGYPLHNARVIHGGTDVERFKNGRKRNGQLGYSRLLYAGQLVQHKGVHTAIEAIEKLVDRQGMNQITLTLIGSGHPDYEAYLHAMVERKHLQEYVTFHTPVTKDEMPGILQEFDVLIFPSIYEEPLARIVQEAMATGLVVVGTTTGGTKEMLEDGETGLTFAPEDVDGLAKQISRVVMNPDLSRRLAQTGRQVVLEKFTLDRMAEEIETYLLECLAENPVT